MSGLPPLHRRLSEKLPGWQAIGADPTTLKWIKHGVPVEFLGGKPPAPFVMHELPVSEQESKWWLSKEAPRLIALGVLSEVPVGVEVPDHISKAFCVPKPEPGNFRLVANLRRLNAACRGHPCRYETLKLLRRWGIADTWMVKVDLQDAFYHVPIAPSDRKYFSFRFCGQLYQFNVLPMGWLNSPYYFSKIMRNVVRFWRDPTTALRRRQHQQPPLPPHVLFPSPRRAMGGRAGVRVLPYLDDFLFIFCSKEQAGAGAVWIKAVLDSLGLATNPKKCEWEPSQSVHHLGITVNTAAGVFEVPREKLRKIRRLAVDLRVTAKKNHRLVLKRELAKFCGFAQSVKLAISPANLFLRNAYTDISQPVSWSGRVRLSRRTMRDLDWWASLDVKHTSAPIQLRPAVVELYCDASDHSWGGKLGNMVARSFWGPDELPAHINMKELRAVRYSLLSFLSHVRDRVVMVREDNTTTQAILGKGSSRSPALHDEFRKLWMMLEEFNIVLQVSRVASADNLADAASRWLDSADYKLHPRWFKWLETRYGPHDVDLFATNTNKQLPRFYSRFYCPGSSGVDSLLQPWGGQNCYANPPYDAEMLSMVVQKLKEDHASATLVVPYWPAQPWWQQLMEITTDLVILPQEHDLFAPGLGGSAAYLPPPRWQAAVARVDWSAGC